MKKNYLYLILCLFWLLPACSDSEEELTDYLTPVAGSETAFNQGLSFKEEALTQSVTFDAGKAWSASLEGENVSSWCRISPTKGNAGQSTISVS
ncbi:MAG: BACON domain-containing protein, partial [Bacteroides sp.]|nr:BACON domain-containing protein [Bacteroides sp.]